MTGQATSAGVRRLLFVTLRWDRTDAAERERIVRETRPGGILLFRAPHDGLRAEIDRLRRLVPHPILVCADVERGAGQQLDGASRLPPPAAIAATGDPRLPFEAGRLTATECLAHGIQLLLAPVLDVNVEPRNPIVGTRAFGGDPETVSRYAVEWIRGALDAGAAPCGKHFPGHGATLADSHTGRVLLDRSRERFESVDWPPYRAAIDAGLPAVMTGHLDCPALDPEETATTSRRTLHGILRGELGFDGVVMTDALTMEALAPRAPVDRGLASLRAGCDILLDPPDPIPFAEELERRVATGEVPPGTVEAAVARVDRLARTFPVPPAAAADPQTGADLARRIAESAVTLLRGNPSTVASLLDGRQAVWIDDDGDADPVPLRAALGDVPLHPPGPLPPGEAVAFIPCRERMNKGTTGLSYDTRERMRTLTSNGRPLAGAVLLGSPVAVRDLPDVPVVLCTYGSDPASLRAAVAACRGRIPCRGRNPLPTT